MAPGVTFPPGARPHYSLFSAQPAPKYYSIFNKSYKYDDEAAIVALLMRLGEFDYIYHKAGTCTKFRPIPHTIFTLPISIVSQQLDP